MRSLAIAVATWFGAGYAPVAPGTAGALAGLAIAWLMHQYLGAGPLVFGLMGVIVFFPGVWAARETAIAVGKKDPGLVVVDEVMGTWITLAGASTLNWKSWLLAFALFRIFDIWKPAPVRQLEKLPGGWGIMADDAMAGVYGALIMAGMGCFNLY